MHRKLNPKPSAPRLAALALGLAIASCVAPTKSEPTATPSAPPANPSKVEAAPWSPAPGWQSMARIDFEAMLLAQLAAPPAPLTVPSATQVAQAANPAGQPELEMRAVLLLAACRTPAADKQLIELLETRLPIAERHSDAAMVVAAARLSQSDLPGMPARLAGLAAGPAAYPDLEVRTECARSALIGGNGTVLDFLLATTRLGTPLGLARDGNWQEPKLSTWSRNRAAETLAHHAGIPCPYRGDASIAGREEASLALEAAIAGLEAE